MGPTFHRIHLWSQNAANLIHFLTQVFDAAVTPLDAGLYAADFEGLELIIQGERPKSSSVDEMQIELKVAQASELHQYLMKAQFFYYRTPEVAGHGPALQEIQQDGGGSFLQVMDPDGRRWRLMADEDGAEKGPIRA